MKPRYKLDKRQKELARKQKRDRKKEEKNLRKDQPAGAADADSTEVAASADAGDAPDETSDDASDDAADDDSTDRDTDEPGAPDDTRDPEALPE